jgi:predicted permease
LVLAYLGRCNIFDVSTGKDLGLNINFRGVKLANVLNIVLIPVLMGVGVGFQRVKFLKPSYFEYALIYFTLPILLFVQGLTFEGLHIGNTMGIALLYLSLCFIVSFLDTSSLPRLERGTTIFNSTFLNSVFMPFPIIFALYGDISAAVIISIPIILIHNSFGTMLACYYGRGKGGFSIIFNTLKFPPLIAFVIGVLLRPFSATITLFSIYDPIQNIGLLTIYLSLIFAGIYLPISKSSLKINNRGTGLTVVNRAIISPLMMALIIVVFGLGGLLARTFFIMSLMPPAFTNIIVVSRFSLDRKTTSQSIFLLTFLGLALVMAFRSAGIL